MKKQNSATCKISTTIDDDDMWPFSMHDISLNLGDLLPPLALIPPLIPSWVSSGKKQ